VGINDTFGCRARSYEDVLRHHGLTAERIAEAVEKMEGY
jgi:transketolase C-terminal domain/subunit